MGNQMFQFSFARWLETKGHSVGFDVSACRWDGVTPLLRGSLGDQVLASTRMWPTPIGRAAPVGRLMRLAIGPRSVSVDLTASGSASTGDPVRPAWFFGYWQQERFAATARDELRELLGLHERTPGQEGIAVHVRRGDYVHLGQALDAGWYRRAVLEARDRLPTAPVTVVSDDIDWCRSHLGLDGVSYSANTAPEVDLGTLAQARLVVASRSSFSWWGSYLGHRNAIYPPAADSAGLWSVLGAGPLS
jgi:hypothetical protein